MSANPRVDKLVSYDKMGCGFKLMCELAAMPETQLQDDEKIILALNGKRTNLQKFKKLQRIPSCAICQSQCESSSENRHFDVKNAFVLLFNDRNENL